jgi:hypothetical protein
MLGVTGFGLLLTPVFYVVIMWFKERRAKTPRAHTNTTCATFSGGTSTSLAAGTRTSSHRTSPITRLSKFRHSSFICSAVTSIRLTNIARAVNDQWM